LQALISDNKSQLSSAFSLTTTPSIDPGNSSSVFQATPAARAPLLLLQHPSRKAQKRNYTQAQLSISRIIFYLI
jgi:hypothetical protein